jgi:metal-responsive CopG/Arc/MetJ family transcriptional regulator
MRKQKYNRRISIILSKKMLQEVSERVSQTDFSLSEWVRQAVQLKLNLLKNAKT